MHRYLSAFALTLLLAASTGAATRFAVDPSRSHAEWVRAPSPPVPPEESVARFDLPPGFRAELVAAEPLVEDPVDIAFGPDGRLWVVELLSYNWPVREKIGLPPADPPGDRIVVLEDTNGDGRFDKRTVFKDGLHSPRTVSVVAGGVLVSAPPDLWFFKDTNGDGVADYEEKVADDYGPRTHPHAMPNGLMWAMDNWIYSARSTARFRWAGGKWERDEPVASRGQWGITQDNWGRLIYNVQSDPLRADLVRPAYWRRNPNFPEEAGIHYRLVPDRSVFPHAPTPGVQPGVLTEQGKISRFTSSCTPAVYRGENFPREMVGDVFVNVPTANFIRRFVLSGEDNAMVATNAYKTDREFLWVYDERFRPVHTYSGPDGALYVVDMYRGILEGHVWIKDSMLDFAAASGFDKPFSGLGRIYRIVYDGRPLGEWPKDLDKQSPEQWVKHLSHPNGWWRDTSQRLLVEAEASEQAPALRRLAEDRRVESYVRLHAMWTLHGLGELEAATVLLALEDPSYRVRETALHFAEAWLEDPQVFAAVLALADDERVEVRRQLVFTLGESKSRAAEEAMRRQLWQDGDKAWVREAAVSGLYGRELRFLEGTLADPNWRTPPAGAEGLVQMLARASTNEGDPDRLGRLATLLRKQGWWQSPIFTGMKEGRRTNLARSQEAMRVLEGMSDPTLQARAAELAAAAREPEPEARVNLARLPEETRLLFERGQVGYQLCAACHKPDGTGMEGVAPSLADSPWVIRPVDGLIRIVLHGLSSNPDLSPMNGFGSLQDDELAAILTYLKLRWGQGTPNPVLPERIREVRERTGGRQTAWTPQELRPLY